MTVTGARYRWNVASIRLEVLRLHSVCNVAAETFLRSLNLLVHLREVVISNIDVEAYRMAPFLRQQFKMSGSLWRMSIPTELERHQLETYGLRNRAVPELLRGFPEAMEGSAAQGHAMRETTPNVLLFPFLFCASLQARRTAPRNLLTGLLLLSSCTDSPLDLKRSSNMPGMFTGQGRSDQL
jgi:hypothetical protein